MVSQIYTRLLVLFAFLSSLQLALADEGVTSSGVKYVTYTAANGETVYLEDNRKPSLYTGNFGDCLGGSTINVSRFDAAYYKDNMTVLFHLAGNSGVANDSLMMYIGVFAYGEDRFDLIFNPCSANIYSLCPLNSSLPITAAGIIPVSPSDVANIPAIALSIPDFEGEAILRIFSNTTHEEIACYSAVVTNGNSFGQPESVGSVLGVFTFVALIGSFATAIYGEAVPTMRLHYAHSLSVGVVFAVWQHIFFSGALSVNWPSVLVAWWSNFAWAGGMIYSSSMQNNINNFIGNNIGNTSQVGAAQAGSANPNVGGGYDISQIYKRAFTSGVKRPANHPLMRDIASEIFGRDPGATLKRDVVQRTVGRTLLTRATGENSLVDASQGFKWYGDPVGEGFPLPGNYSGFAGTLAEERIRIGNAFMTGFLWFLIALVLLVACVVAFKWLLEGLARIKWIKQDRLQFFRSHWIGYTTVSALRICFIAWFMIMFLTIFQFTYHSSAGVMAVAGVVFTIFFLGMPAIAAYAWWYKYAVTDSANYLGEHNRLLGGRLPLPRLRRKANQQAARSEVEAAADGSQKKDSSKPFWKRKTSSGDADNQEDGRQSVHDDDDYTMKFGWLAARFRRTRWWFFTAWLFYEFLRALFYGAASGYAQAQVFGLLVIEFLAFVFILWARPFEGQRLNILVVYCLGFSKVATVALSAAFDVQFNLQRIITTVIGIVIIVIQGILTIITLIAIVIGAISSYMSVSRNSDSFRPQRLQGTREKYFDHLDRVVNDLPREPKPRPEPKAKRKPVKEVVVEETKIGFEMKNVRRLTKIEDDDAAFASEAQADSNGAFVDAAEHAVPVHGRSNAGTPHNRSRANSRAQSMHSVNTANLPFGARAHRTSWSTRDFPPVDAYASERRFGTPADTNRGADDDEPLFPPASAKRHSRGLSRSSTLPTTLQYQRSTETLNVGGEVSTLDTIGMVPPPAVRPRAGTHSSLGGSLHGTRHSDFLGSDLPDSQPPSQRTSVNYGHPSGGYGNALPLTPAQEVEEYIESKAESSAR